MRWMRKKKPKTDSPWSPDLEAYLRRQQERMEVQYQAMRKEAERHELELIFLGKSGWDHQFEIDQTRP